MNSSIIRTLVTIGLAATMGQSALKAQNCIKAAVPFNFAVGAKSYAAGDYCIKPVNQDVLLVRDATGHQGTMTMTIPIDPKKRADGLPVLTFKHYGDSYFLSKVSDGSHGWQFFPSAKEKELLAKRVRPNPVSVAASLTAK